MILTKCNKAVAVARKHVDNSSICYYLDPGACHGYNGYRYRYSYYTDYSHRIGESYLGALLPESCK